MSRTSPVLLGQTRIPWKEHPWYCTHPIEQAAVPVVNVYNKHVCQHTQVLRVHLKVQWLHPNAAEEVEQEAPVKDIQQWLQCIQAFGARQYEGE